MFWLLRMIISVIGFLIIAGIVIYFLPHNLKLKAVEAITGIVPASLEEETNDLLLTPGEERERLVSRLETNLEALKDASAEETAALIQKSEELVHELKEKSGERSLAEIAKEKIVAGLVQNNLCGLNGTTTPQ